MLYALTLFLLCCILRRELGFDNYEPIPSRQPRELGLEEKAARLAKELQRNSSNSVDQALKRLEHQWREETQKE
jgi:hypothetical protein